jgi:hypothetical protein
MALPPCLTSQQSGIFWKAPTKQLLQSSSDKSRVHCTSAYNVWNFGAVAFPATNLRSGPPTAAWLLRFYTKIYKIIIFYV